MGMKWGFWGGDPDNRRVMPWQTDQLNLPLQTFVKKLIAWRRQYGAFLRRAAMAWLDPHDATLMRQTMTADGERLQLTMNTGTAASSIYLPGNNVLLMQGYEGHQLAPLGFIISKSIL